MSPRPEADRAPGVGRVLSSIARLSASGGHLRATWCARPTALRSTSPTLCRVAARWPRNCRNICLMMQQSVSPLARASPGMESPTVAEVLQTRQFADFLRRPLARLSRAGSNAALQVASCARFELTPIRFAAGRKIRSSSWAFRLKFRSWKPNDMGGSCWRSSSSAYRRPGSRTHRWVRWKGAPSSCGERSQRCEIRWSEGWMRSGRDCPSRLRCRRKIRSTPAQLRSPPWSTSVGRVCDTSGG